MTLFADAPPFTAAEVTLPGRWMAERRVVFVIHETEGQRITRLVGRPSVTGLPTITLSLPPIFLLTGKGE